MLSGTAAALVFPLVFEGLPLYYFPLLFVISLIGSIAGALATPATDIETLKAFYQTVRPWGFWKPVYEQVILEHPTFEANKDFGRDLFNVAVGIVSQICMALLPMFLILGQTAALLTVVVILAVCALTLKKTWWNR
jgi:hypothetical protein